jgi:hypothetical protein
MTDLERFLQLATWSLWGAQKRTVRLELESHIAHKTWKYQTRGFSETEALQKALVDLGQPHVISAGMTGVYTMPTLFRNTVLVSLLLSLGITTFQSSAQVAGTSRTPIQPCLKSTSETVKFQKYDINCEDTSKFFLSLEQLKTDLEPKGVKFQENTEEFTNGYEKGTPILTFPKGKPVYITQGGGLGFGKTNFDYSKKFVMADTFLTYNLPQSGLPVTLSGWEKPVVGVGEIQFDISFPQKKPKPQYLYGSIVFESITNLFNKQGTGFGITHDDDYVWYFFSFQKIYRNLIQFNANPNRVYVLIRMEKDNLLSIYSRVLHLDTDNFNVTSQLKNLEFVDSWNKLKPMTLDSTNPQRSGTVILARINTKMNDRKQILEIVNPNEIRVLGNAERLIARDTTQGSFCKDKGGANTAMAGHWIGEFQSVTPKGQHLTGVSNSRVQPNGVYEGLLQSHSADSKGVTIGAFCKNNQFTGSYEFPQYSVQTVIGSIKQITPTLIEGSSIERDENNKIFSRSYFRLRKP